MVFEFCQRGAPVDTPIRYLGFSRNLALRALPPMMKLGENRTEQMEYLSQNEGTIMHTYVIAYQGSPLGGSKLESPFYWCYRPRNASI